ncbi:MaoC family dehydratase, partial [Candidatus Entotheonella palauensis]
MDSSAYAVGTELPVHTLRAINEATESENKIHDDTVAAQYGFRGGLVPGVSVYAYMTYPLVQAFGTDWLTRGTAQVTLSKPVYENDDVTVSATVTSASETELRFDIRSVNPDGVACGVGYATLPVDQATVPAIDTIAVGKPAERVPVHWDLVVVGEPLPMLEGVMDQAENEAYCQSHSDDLALYQGPDAYIHPGWLLQRCNRIFSNRFILNPWIHVGSEITMYRPCRVG